MVETDNFTSDWSQLLDDMPNEPGAVMSPQLQSATIGSVSTGDLPISSSFASSNKKSTPSFGGSSSNSSSSNNNNKKRFPWWMLLVLFLLFGSAASAATGYNPIYRALEVVGIEGNDGKDGADGLDGINGQDGKVVKQTTIIGSSSSASGSGSGADGADGASGQDGADGTNGADGADGSNACISGLCVSRQASTPGTQETGNINIDGTVLASQVGVNASPTNTLSVGGTANIGGHSATGGGATVNGITSASDALSGATAHNTIAAVYETVTTLDEASTMYEGLGGVLKLNPSAAPVYGQATGNNGGVEIVSGNTQNFGGNIQGMNGNFIHAGTGTVTSATALQGPFLNTSTGNVTNGYGIRSIGINYNLSDTSCVTNETCMISNYTGVDSTFAINLGTITNYKGIQIQTPTNAGTITNNWGLYIQDQSSVGSTTSYNLYSAGSTAKNYFAGLVGIGADSTPDASLEVVNDGSGDSFLVADTNDSDASPFVIDSTGKVGIRTASPGTNNSVLEVTGSAYISDYVYTSMLRSATESNSKIDLYDSSAGIAFIAQNNTKDFRWAINSGSDLMTLDGATGKLGIGTATPGAMLEAVATSTTPAVLGTGSAGTAGAIGVKGTAYSYGVYGQGSIVGVYGTGGGASGYGVHGQSGAAEGTGVYAQAGNRGSEVGISAFGGKFTGLFENGYADETGGAVVKILSSYSGKVNPALLVQQDGTAGVTMRLTDTTGTCDFNPDSGSLGTSCSSDARLKANITDAASVLSEINGLKIRDYTVLASGSETTGLIAQEVLETNPEMVHMGEDGYYKVDSYNPWKVLKGVQELSSNLDDLQTSFTTALEQTNGNLDATNQSLADLGLRVDDLSTTLQTYADQLAAHDQRIQALEAKVQSLEQAN